VTLRVAVAAGEHQDISENAVHYILFGLSTLKLFSNLPSLKRYTLDRASL
jgi:hypothetical protein